MTFYARALLKEKEKSYEERRFAQMDAQGLNFKAFEAILYYCELFNDFKLTYSNDYQAHYLVKVENLNPLYHNYQVDDNTDDSIVNWFKWDFVADKLIERLKHNLDVFKDSFGYDFDWYAVYHDEDISIKNGHHSPVKPHIHLILMFDEYVDLQNCYFNFVDSFQRRSYKITQEFTCRKKVYKQYTTHTPLVTDEAARFKGIPDSFLVERIQYLCHMNNKEKAQYSTARVYGSLVYSTDVRLSCNPDLGRNIFDTTVDFILSHPHYTGKDIVQSVRQYGSESIKKEFRSHSGLYKMLAGGNR